MIETDPDGQTYTTVFTYNRNKIQSDVSDDGWYSTYTYSGDLISKIETFVDNELYQTDLFEYNSDQKLTVHKMLSYSEDLGNRDVYMHNANGSISYSRFVGDISSQIIGNGSGTMFFTNGEISRIETIGSEEIYSYDGKNNPSKNILGMDKISYILAEPEGFQQNVTSRVFTGSDNSTASYTYSYNDADFPVTSNDVSEDFSTQYFYN